MEFRKRTECGGAGTGKKYENTLRCASADSGDACRLRVLPECFEGPERGGMARPGPAAIAGSHYAERCLVIKRPF